MKNVDAALIVAARNALPRLIAALREARGSVMVTPSRARELEAERDAALKERDEARQASIERAGGGKNLLTELGRVTDEADAHYVIAELHQTRAAA